MVPAGYSIGLNRNGEMKDRLLYAGRVCFLEFFLHSNAPVGSGNSFLGQLFTEFVQLKR